jgi:hypothetical protein
MYLDPNLSLENRTAVTAAIRRSLLAARLCYLIIHPFLNVGRVPPCADTLRSFSLAARLAALTCSTQHAGDEGYGSETVGESN